MLFKEIFLVKIEYQFRISENSVFKSEISVNRTENNSFQLKILKLS